MTASALQDFAKLRQRVEKIRRVIFGDGPLTQSAPLGSIALAVVFALLGAVIMTWASTFCNAHNADSILPAIMSTRKLTLFYWGQNRFGNLLPFATSWISNIDWNLKAQVLLRCISAMALPWFVMVATRSQDRFALKYLLTIALIFTSYPHWTLHSIFTEGQPYALSLLLITCAIVTFDRQADYSKALSLPALAALTLTMLAFFVNASLVIFIFPAWLGITLMYPTQANIRMLVAIVISFLSAIGLAAWHGIRYGDAGNYFRINISVENFSLFFSSVAQGTHAWMVAAHFLLVVAGLLFLQSANVRRRACGVGTPIVAPVVARGAVLGLAALAYLFVVATLEWTRINEFAFRYFSLAFIVFCCLSVVLAVDAFAEFMSGSSADRPGRCPIGVFAALALFLTALGSRAWPIDSQCRFISNDGTAADSRVLADAARKHGASFLVGDYWSVWPAAFETIRSAQADGQDRPVFGLSYRGHVMSAEIDQHLRGRANVAMVCIAISVEECSGRALKYNIASWPSYVTVLERGPLPSGSAYTVVSLSEKVEHESSPDLPLRRVLLSMLALGDTATRGPSSISAKGTGLILFGPYATLGSPGQFRISYKLSGILPASAGDKLLIRADVANNVGQDILADKVFRLSDLRKDGASWWADLEFATKLPIEKTTSIEFRLSAVSFLDIEIWEVVVERLDPNKARAK